VPFFFGQAAGSNLTWRVDRTFAPHGVTADGNRAFGAFLAGEQHALASMSYKPTTSLADGLRVAGYQGADRALLLVRDWNANWTVAAPAVRQGVQLSVAGLAPGSYVAEFWDTQRGTHIDQSLRITSSSITLSLPAFQRDVAIKIHRAA
jgi:hypothetical protein